MMKTKSQYIALLKDFKDRYASKYGILKIGIFGSVARNEQRESSDIDVFVQLNHTDFMRYCDLKRHLESELETEVDLLRMRPTLRPLLLQRIQEYGIQI